MTSVGIILKKERERQKREPAEIAEELCITQRYLRAIEQDDLGSLPGAFFYKSFVKQYAAILGVDEMLLKPGVESLTASSNRCRYRGPIHVISVVMFRVPLRPAAEIISTAIPTALRSAIWIRSCATETGVT